MLVAPDIPDSLLLDDVDPNFSDLQSLALLHPQVLRPKSDSDWNGIVLHVHGLRNRRQHLDLGKDV